MSLWFVAAIILCVIVGGYLVLIAYDARFATKNAPREDMFTCDKHGLVPRKYTKKLSGITAEPIELCPFCFEDKFKEADKRAQKIS